ncbi:MAG: hypothetical protein ACREID_01065, partial [Planctomycetota bacterium]
AARIAMDLGARGDSRGPPRAHEVVVRARRAARSDDDAEALSRILAVLSRAGAWDADARAQDPRAAGR